LMMHGFFAALGRFTVRFRWVILVIWILGTAAAVKTLPSLGSVVNNNNTAFLPANAPDVKAADLAAPLVGKESLEPIDVIAYVKSGQLSKSDIVAIQTEARLLRSVANVERVEFIGISADHKAIQLAALANIAGFSPVKSVDTVDGVTDTFAAAHAPSGLAFYVGGQVADAVYQNKQSNSTGNKTQDLSVVFIIVLLLLIFRSVLAPFVTLLPAFIVLQLSGSIIGELGTHAGLKVSEISQLLLIVIILGAGTDYGLFLVFRVREGIRDGLEGKQAVSLAVARVGESITGSITTSVSRSPSASPPCCSPASHCCRRCSPSSGKQSSGRHGRGRARRRAAPGDAWRAGSCSTRCRPS
jgi:RND superfamily putative drug exporter